MKRVVLAMMLGFTLACGGAEAPLQQPGTPAVHECTSFEPIDLGGVQVGEQETASLTFGNPSSEAVTASIASEDPRVRFDVSPRFTVPPRAGREVAVTLSPDAIGPVNTSFAVQRAHDCPERRVTVIADAVQSLVTVSPLDGVLGSEVPELEVVFENWSYREVVLSELRTVEGASPATLVQLRRADPSDLTRLTVPRAGREGGVLFPGRATLVVAYSGMGGGHSAGLRARTSLRTIPTVLVSLRVERMPQPSLRVSPSPLLDLGHLIHVPDASPPSSAVRHLAILNAGSRTDPPDLRANLRLGNPDAGLTAFEVRPLNEFTSASELCIGSHDVTGPGCPGALEKYDPLVGIETGWSGALSVPVRVMPSSSGPKRWEVTVNSNDPAHPRTTVQVTATVLSPPPPCALRLTPPSLDFGTLSQGQQRSLSVTLRNEGSRPEDVRLLTGARLEDNDRGLYSFESGRFTDVLLGPGQAYTVAIRALQRFTVTAPTRVEAGLAFEVSSSGPRRVTLGAEVR